MIVCLCHGVSDRDIAREALAGCADFDALKEELLVGTACGACVDHALEAFGEHAVARQCRSRHAAACCGSLSLGDSK